MIPCAESHLRFANKTYEAEYIYWRKMTSKDDPLKEQVTDQQAIDLIRDALGSDWQYKRTHGLRNGTCYTISKRICLGREAPKWVLLHELGHGFSSNHGHNARFRGAYLEMLRRYGSAEHADGLEQVFSHMRLSIENPVTPT